ncbi:hypothetical protein L3Q82_021972 [Scortum barcoo]|uniref:Uncharacterized protein n=1 Tax=Scortum barcoo TaxID=214431 RepID=A0ACB8X197_9TELE|nr:hypothetical protein L3Q82_021972 [Scortum barcoo]
MEYHRHRLTTEGLCEGAGTPPPAHIQPELGTGEGSPAVEDILHHSSPQETTSWKTGVEDAIIFLLHRSLSHLDSGAVITFLDYSGLLQRLRIRTPSSHFQPLLQLPLLLRDKLTEMGVGSHLVAWITDYLTGRPQYVRLGDWGNCRSDTVASSTGAPQGTVLSPVLFTLCQHTGVDSGQEDEYRELIKDFVTWCDLNHLLLNTTKTREMVDFGPRPHPEPVIIKGVIICDQRGLKGQSRRLYFLRRLASFNICKKLLQIFYQSVVAVSERPPVRSSVLEGAASSVLGGQPQEEGRSAPGQTGELLAQEMKGGVQTMYLHIRALEIERSPHADGRVSGADPASAGVSGVQPPTTAEARKAAGPDGISSRLLKSCADQLCGIFRVHIQPEPEAGESTTALEDVLHRPSAKDTAPQGAQQLQAGSSDVSSDEDAGETGPRPSAPAGELLHGPAAVRLPA